MGSHFKALIPLRSLAPSLLTESSLGAQMGSLFLLPAHRQRLPLSCPQPCPLSAGAKLPPPPAPLQAGQLRFARGPLSGRAPPLCGPGAPGPWQLGPLWASIPQGAPATLPAGHVMAQRPSAMARPVLPHPSAWNQRAPGGWWATPELWPHTTGGGGVGRLHL